MEELRTTIEKTGFTDIDIVAKEDSDRIIRSWNFGEDVKKMVFSAYIKAKKPERN